MWGDRRWPPRASLVKTVRVGKKRSFARGLLLTIVTFGIYGLYWSYKAPHEVYRQFDLEDEGRDEGVVWLILGLLIPFLIIVYYWKAIDNLRYIRTRLGLADRLKPGTFVALFVGPNVVLVLLYLVLVLPLIAATPDAAESASGGAFVGIFLALLIGALVGLVLTAAGFAMFQRDINEVWDAWLARMRELTAPPPAPPAWGAPAPGLPAWTGAAPPPPASPGWDRPDGPQVLPR